MISEINLIFSLLKTCWSGITKKWLIRGWVILVIPVFSHLQWISFSAIYIFIVLMVLTHPQGYIGSSSSAVLIMCRATTSCTKYLATIMWGNTRSLSADFLARIRGSQYQHASYIQTGNCTPSWSTSYMCSILHGWLVVILLLMNKQVIPK